MMFWNLFSILREQTETFKISYFDLTPNQSLWEKMEMTNLDSILKSRDITMPTKVRLVKAIIFPVVMYGCESWTIKKAGRQRIDAFELWCWTIFLRVT